MVNAFSAFVHRCGWLLAGLIVFIPIYAFFFSFIYPQWHIYSRIVHSGMHTEGVVTAKEPMNHAGIRYEYSVAGRLYSGSCTTGFGGIPPLEKIEVGQEIPVAYFSDDPSLSLPGDPHDLYYSWSGLLFIWMPLIIAALAFGVAFALKPRRNDPVPQTI
jgi:hypothetical protein